jgi:hypothetical protein
LEEIMTWCNAIFDLDDVLGASSRTWLDAAYNIYGIRIAFEQLVRYDTMVNIIYNHIRQNGDNKHEVKMEIRRTIFSIEVSSTIEPIPEAQKIIKILKALGFNIGVATSRTSDHDANTIEWLRTYYPEVSPAMIYTRTEGESKFDTKSVALKKHTPIVYIDDDGSVIMDLVQEGFGLKTCLGLMDRPWNRHLSVRRNTYRLKRLGYWEADENDPAHYGWEKTLEWIKRIKRNKFHLEP